MAVVTRADCTQVSTTEKTYFNFAPADAAAGTPETLAASIDIRDVNYNACTGVDANNNLYERVRKLEQLGKLETEKVAAVREVLVGSQAGKCNAAIETFLGTKNITRTLA